MCDRKINRALSLLMSSFKPKYIAYAMPALGHGLVAILTHILDQEKFDNCCNAPFVSIERHFSPTKSNI